MGDTKLEILKLTAKTVSVSPGEATQEEVEDLIEVIFNKFLDLYGDKSMSTTLLKPAVPVEDSIQQDYLVCLEDGKKMKMLRRYLMTSYGMTPEQYRKRWGLPRDYPMTAPSYSEKRSGLAKESGLGTHRKKRDED